MVELHIPYLAHVSIESVEGRTPDLSDKIPGIFLDAIVLWSYRKEFFGAE